MEEKDLENGTMEEAPVPTPSKRDTFIARLRETDEESNYDDDDVFYDRLIKDYDSMNSNNTELESFRSESKKINDLFDTDPRAAEMMLSWKDGFNPVAFLMEQYGDDFKNALEDESLKEELAEKHANWVEKQLESKKRDEEAEENLKLTIDTISQVAEEQGWTPEQKEQVWTKVYDTIIDGTKGIVAPETFVLISKGLNFDNAVAEASATGEIKGKNAKIEEKLEKQAPVVPPTLGGGAGTMADPEPKAKPKSMWDPSTRLV